MGIKNSLIIVKSIVLSIFKKLFYNRKSIVCLHATFHTRDRWQQVIQINKNLTYIQILGY